jgi:hypothetical protein
MKKKIVGVIAKKEINSDIRYDTDINKSHITEESEGEGEGEGEME